MQFLPGIPDEVTLDHITPKLPWRTLHILSSVSRPWRQAIQSRLVHDARVRAHSTETLIVHNHCYDDDKTHPIGRESIALYSTSDKRCYEFPPIPGLQRGIPRSCECVSFDGKIYVLGGVSDDYDTHEEVYVLDVVGHRQWEQCASMSEARESFGSGVVEGKIYVFGGVDFLPVYECEVYDPKINVWSPIMPMLSWREDHQVAAVGEELFVCGGQIYDSDLAPEDMDDPDWCGHDWWEHLESPDFLEVYNTVKDEWRTIDDVDNTGSVFMAKGNLHRMCRFGIDAFDNDENAWVNRWTNSYAAGIAPRDPSMGSARIIPYAPLVVNDELFVRVRWNYFRAGILSDDRAGLLQSKGFETENKEIRWQKTNCCFDLEGGLHRSILYAIQL